MRPLEESNCLFIRGCLVLIFSPNEQQFFSSRLLQGLSDSDTLNFLSFFLPTFAISGTVYDKQSIPLSLVSLVPFWPPGSLHVEVLDVSVKHTAQGLAARGCTVPFRHTREEDESPPQFEK